VGAVPPLQTIVASLQLQATEYVLLL